MPIRVVVTGLLLLAVLGGCSQLPGSVEESTADRLADQYEFENRYTDVDDPD